jgi:hypothetical protein
MDGACNIHGGSKMCTVKMSRSSEEEMSLVRRRHTALYGSTLFRNKVLCVDTAA